MKKIVICAVIASSMSLSACSSLNNEEVGSLAGGVIGGLVGSRFGGGAGQVIATGAGTLVGAYIGSNIGKTMDRQDQMRLEKALERTKVGKSQSWTNPDSGNKYSVKPTKTYYNGDTPCRTFSTTAYINGKKEVVHGKACRSNNGRWVMQ